MISADRPLSSVLIGLVILFSALSSLEVFGQPTLAQTAVPTGKTLKIELGTDGRQSELQSNRLQELEQILLDREAKGQGIFAYIPSSDLGLASSQSLRFSPDGEFLWSGIRNNRKALVGRINEVFRRVTPLTMPRLWDLQSGREIRRFGGHKGERVTSIGLSADNQYCATAAFTYGQADYIIPEVRDLIVWDVTTGEELFKLDDLHIEAAMTTDGEWLITSTGAMVVGYRLKEMLKNATPAPTWLSEFSCRATPAIAISPDNMLVAVIRSRKDDEERGIFFLDTKNGGIVGRIPDQTDQLPVWSPDSTRLLTISGSQITIWDATRQREVRRMIENGPIYTAQFDDSGEEVIAVLADSMSRLSIASGDVISHQPMHYGDGHMRISPDRQMMVTAGDGVIEFVSLKNGCSVARITQFHEERLWHVETIDGYFDASAELLKADARAISKSGLKHDPIRVRETLSLLAPQHSPEALPKPSPEGRRLFVLSVGVSKHKHSEYDLKYAAVDAKSLAEELTEQGKPMYAEVFTEVYTDENATLENLKKGLDVTERPKDTRLERLKGYQL